MFLSRTCLRVSTGRININGLRKRRNGKQYQCQRQYRIYKFHKILLDMHEVTNFSIDHGKSAVTLSIEMIFYNTR